MLIIREKLGYHKFYIDYITIILIEAHKSIKNQDKYATKSYSIKQPNKVMATPRCPPAGGWAKALHAPNT